MGSRVLFVVPNVPHPLRSGGHLRDWQILNLLGRAGVRPALLYFGAGEVHRLTGDDPVSERCASVAFGAARVEDPDGGHVRTAVRKLSYLGGWRPHSHPFAYQYDAIGAGKIIEREAARVGAEIVVLRGFWCHHAPALKAAGLRVVANCPDANVRLAREMVRSVRGPLRKLGPLCNMVGVRRHERRYLPLADEVWVPTATEAAEVHALGGRARVLTVPNLVDVDAYPNLADDPPEQDALLFVGSFGYAPNANAAEMLLTRIFPAIRRRRPGARLLLVGRGLPARLQAMAQRDASVETPGFVDDVKPWYRRAAVVVLPVTEGAGMLFKTVEALACGKAAVGVPHAFRGLDVHGARPFTTAAGWRGLAGETVRLLADGGARRALGAQARTFAETRLSWDYGDRCLAESMLLEGACS